ncbi:putative metalloprotease CJM1_0395 family protein [Thalassotalea fusca]
MNITPLPTTLPTATVFNPQTESLRRENQQREVITQTAPLNQSAAEKGVASERERAKTPAQFNEQIDFANLREQAKLDNSTITEQHEHQDSPQQQAQDHEENISDSSENGGQSVSADDESETNDDTAQDRVKEFAEQQTIKELQVRDREVRSHELAHATAGGPYTGSPSYSFEVGPDGKKYAVEGEVSVDLEPIDGNPRATIAKMQKVYNAALAPANPSIQDMRIANAAAQQIARAQSQLLNEASSVDSEDNNEADANARTRGTFSTESANDRDERDFDQLINETLASQEAIAPSRSIDVDLRAVRIEHFYADINHAYEKPPRNQFELTA